MPLTAVNPDSLAPPRGYNHGMKGAGELLFVAGQVGWTREGHVVSADFISQFQRALENVIDVVWTAGGRPADIGRMVVDVTDKCADTARAREIGEIWRARMGRHYPAMALVAVKGLLDDEDKVAIGAMAML